VNASGHVEREVKLDADPDLVLPDLTADRPEVTVSGREPQELDATYYDAADLRLLADGVTVRRRSGEGTRWTVKVPAAGSGPGTMNRIEHDVFDEATEPPAEVRALVAGWLGDAPLVAVARLLSSRARLELRTVAAGRVLAEVDDDLVVVRDGDREAGRFREIEIELAHDLSEADEAEATSLVDAVVASLVAAGARRDRMRPKVDRALDLIGRP